MPTIGYKGEPFRTLTYEPGPITKIVHTEPKRRNVLNTRFILEFGEALKHFQQNHEAVVAVFLAEGPVFCAGHDLGFVAKMEDWKPKNNKEKVAAEAKPSASEPVVAGEEDWREQMDFMRERLYYPIWDCKKPIVAGVQGGAYGGGCEIVNMCDIVVATEDAFFDWGVVHITGGGADPLLGYLGGWRKAMEIALTGWNYDAREAYRLGIVNKVVPRDKLEEEVLLYAKAIAAMRPESVKFAKQVVRFAMNRMGARDTIWFSAETDIVGHTARSDKEDEFYRITKEKGLRAAVDWAHKPFEELGYSRFGPGRAKKN